MTITMAITMTPALFRPLEVSRVHSSKREGKRKKKREKNELATSRIIKAVFIVLKYQPQKVSKAHTEGGSERSRSSNRLWTSRHALWAARPDVSFTASDP